MTSVTVRALYVVTDWDRKWWTDESWCVTGRQSTKVQKWRAGVNCSRCKERQPEKLGPRRWIVECGRRSVMKTRQPNNKVYMKTFHRFNFTHSTHYRKVQKEITLSWQYSNSVQLERKTLTSYLSCDLSEFPCQSDQVLGVNSLLEYAPQQPPSVDNLPTHRYTSINSSLLYN